MCYVLPNGLVQIGTYCRSASDYILLTFAHRSKDTQEKTRKCLSAEPHHLDAEEVSKFKFFESGFFL